MASLFRSLVLVEYGFGVNVPFFCRGKTKCEDKTTTCYRKKRVRSSQSPQQRKKKSRIQLCCAAANSDEDHSVSGGDLKQCRGNVTKCPIKNQIGKRTPLSPDLANLVTAYLHHDLKTFATGGKSLNFIVTARFRCPEKYCPAVRANLPGSVTCNGKGDNDINEDWLFLSLNAMDNTPRASNVDRFPWYVNCLDTTDEEGCFGRRNFIWCIRQTVEEYYSVTRKRPSDIGSTPVLYHDPLQTPTLSAADLLGTLLAFGPHRGVVTLGVSAVSHRVAKKVWNEQTSSDRFCFKRKSTDYDVGDCVCFSEIVDSDSDHDDEY